MKQNLPPAKFRFPLLKAVLLATILSTACATIPRPSKSAVQLLSDFPRTERAPVININTASVAELETLPGVGQGIAERIVAHRQQYGPFRRAEHLMMVRGISDRKFRELRTMIVAE